MDKKDIVIIALALILAIGGCYFGFNHAYVTGYDAGTYDIISRQTQTQMYFYSFNNTIQSIPLKDVCGGIQ